MNTIKTTYKLPAFAKLIGKPVSQLLGMVRRGLPVFRNGSHREIDPEVYNEWIKSNTVSLVQAYEKAQPCNTTVGCKVRKLKA